MIVPAMTIAISPAAASAERVLGATLGALEALQELARPVEALCAATRDLASQAGYARVDVLAVENDFFRLYRLS